MDTGGWGEGGEKWNFNSELGKDSSLFPLEKFPYPTDTQFWLIIII